MPEVPASHFGKAVGGKLVQESEADDATGVRATLQRTESVSIEIVLGREVAERLFDFRIELSNLMLILA